MNRDPRDAPAYTGREAIRYCDCGSVRDWIAAGLLAVPRGRGAITFWNLVEVHAIQSIQFSSCHKMWEKIVAASAVLETARPLIARQTPRSLEILASASFGPAPAQLRLQEALSRVEYGEDGLATALFPRTRSARRFVVIQPGLAGGRPAISDTGVETRLIAKQFRDGRSVGELAEQHRIGPEMVEEALRFEVSLRAA